MKLNSAQLDLVRQWFNWMQDCNPAFLSTKDYLLARGVYEALGKPVPLSVTAALLTAEVGGTDADVEFHTWWLSKAHRARYTSDHPAYLAAREAWHELKGRT